MISCHKKVMNATTRARCCPPSPLIPTPHVYLGIEVESVDDHANFVYNLQEPLKFDDGILLLVTEAVRPRLPPVLLPGSSFSEQAILGS